MVFSVFPGGVLSDTGREAQRSSNLHRRLRRGWIWKQLFVPEEDPTPRVIGQVPVQIERPPCPRYATYFATRRQNPLSLRLPPQLKSDSDRGDFSIKYLLSGEGAGDAFEIDERTGDIRLLRRLDREEKAFYVLQAQAINRGSGEPEEPQSEFIVKVQDINDNVPQFQNEPYVSSIPEMCPVGMFNRREKLLTRKYLVREV